jgi:hypothetical protein
MIQKPLTETQLAANSWVSWQSTGFAVWLFLLNLEGRNSCVLIEKRAKGGEGALPRMFSIPLVFSESLFADTLFSAEYLPSKGLILLDDIWVHEGARLDMFSFSIRHTMMNRILEDQYGFLHGYSYADVAVKPASAQVGYPVKGRELRRPEGKLGEIVWFCGGQQEQKPKKAAPKKDNPQQQYCVISPTELPDVYGVVRDGVPSGSAAVIGLEASRALKVLCRDGPARVPCVWHDRFQKWKPVLAS